MMEKILAIEITLTFILVWYLALKEDIKYYITKRKSKKVLNDFCNRINKKLSEDIIRMADSLDNLKEK